MNKFKKHFIQLISSIFLFSCSFISPSKALNTPYSYKISLEEGITFTHNTIENYDGRGGNQEINYLTFDYNNPNLYLDLIKANGRSASKDTLLSQLNTSEKTSEKNVIGGINGEFFSLANGQPLFNTISNGEIFSIIDNASDSLKRPVLYIDENNNYSFDFLTIDGVLSFNSGIFYDLPINSLNKLDSYNDTNVSNYKINNESTYYPHEGLPSRYMLIELYNSDGSFYAGQKMYGKVIEVGEMSEPKKIEKNQLLVTSYGDDNYYDIKYEFLNQSISLQFDIFSNKNKVIKNDIVTAFTGHEYLMKDGIEMNYSYYKTLGEEGFINNRHARTALGITDDNKMILFTVDESSNSLGMTLNELSSFLKDLGIVTAINLDGGGSTSIALEDNTYNLNLMNDPYKYQRKITNGIAIIKK